MRPAFLHLSLAASALCVVPSILHAQAGAGEVAGRVTDSSGAAMPNAQIHLVQNATRTVIDSRTDSTGDFDFLYLAPGAYTVTVKAPNFNVQTIQALNVSTGERTRADMTLTVASGRDLVVVTADPALLETGSGALQTSIPNAEITQLPLNGRNVVNLITLAPGVSLPPGTLLPRINGGRPRTNEYLFDGISALQPEPGQVAFFPIIDDIVDFNVEASGVSAEFGRFNGGVVNLSTRAGTADLHGEIYEFLRNESLNARNYFLPLSSTGQLQRKPEFRRNQYGAALGGPLLGPILNDKLFGFADYQGTNQAVSVTRTSSVPTLAQRGNPDASGNPTTAFSSFAGNSKIYDPATTAGTANQRTEFAGDAIPLIRADPAALALLKFYPLPTNTFAANNFVYTGLDSDHQNQLDTRVDYVPTQHDRAFARYTYFHDVENPVYPLPGGSGAITGSIANTGNVIGLSDTLGQQIVGNEVHLFGPRTLNEARFGYTRRSLARTGPTLGNTASNALGIPGIPTNAAFNNALPVFAIAGYTQLGPTASTDSSFSTNVTEFFDMVTHTVGPHVLKFGTDLRWEALNALQPPNPTGSFAFSTLFTNQPGVTNTGNALASFLLGQVNTFSIDLQKNILQPRAHIAEFFVQDDWRTTSRLTINAGVRYTINFASTEKHNQGGVFNLTTQTYQYLGQNGYPATARDTHYDNFGPRLGINYAIDPRTTIRAGYGLIFIEMTGITTPFTTPQFPFLQTVSQATTDSIHPAFVLSGGPSVAPISTSDPNAGLGQGVFTTVRPTGSGYVQQWNLDLQRALTSSLTVEAGYTGSVITRVGIPDSNLNQLTAQQLAVGLTTPAALTGLVANPYFGKIPVSSSIGGSTVSAAQLLKPYPRFLTVARFRNNTGRSNYNAAEFKLQQRTRYGLDLLISYTHSRLIDDASSVFDSSVLTGPVSNPAVADTFRPYLERDASLGDAPNTTVISAVYRLPAGADQRFAQHGLASALLGGFAVNAVATVQSGMPFAITDATNFNAFAGFGLQRPTISSSANLPKALRTPQHFINTAAFSVTPEFRIGNASRDPARGPAYRDLDLALIRRIGLGGGHENGMSAGPAGSFRNLELRAELFNATNTPAFAQPAAVVGNVAFGSITSTAADQRVAQVAAKLHF
jgi:type II secretory pathway pseudopilin PulG